MGSSARGLGNIVAKGKQVVGQLFKEHPAPAPSFSGFRPTGVEQTLGNIRMDGETPDGRRFAICFVIVPRSAFTYAEDKKGSRITFASDQQLEEIEASLKTFVTNSPWVKGSDHYRQMLSRLQNHLAEVKRARS